MAAALERSIKRLYIGGVDVHRCKYSHEVKSRVPENYYEFAILDLSLGNYKEFKHIKHCHEHGVPALVYSSCHSPSIMREAMACGAKGFVDKAGPISELNRALDAMKRKQFDEPIYCINVKNLLAEMELTSEGFVPKLDLTGGELRVLRMAALGMSIEESAEVLNLSPGTVRKHRQSIYSKNICHLAEAIRRYNHWYSKE